MSDAERNDWQRNENILTDLANARCEQALTQEAKDIVLFIEFQPYLMATEDIKTTLFTQRNPSNSL